MPTSVPPAEFRRWMARFATGVTVVTARDGPTRYGLTVNAFLSVSLQPPTVLVSLTIDADTTPIIRRTGRFAVNLLRADQQSLSERFARMIPPAAKFDGVAVQESVEHLPLLEGTLGALECHVDSEQVVADHVLIVGRVVRLSMGAEALPLVFHQGTYTTSARSPPDAVPPTKR